MNTIIIVVLASIINMIADILLVSGRDYKDEKQSDIDKIKNTTAISYLIILWALDFLFADGFIGAT